MSTPYKGVCVRVWIQDAQAKQLSELSEATGLAQSGLAARLLTAVLEAVEKDGNRVTFPLVVNLEHGPAPRKK